MIRKPIVNGQFYPDSEAEIKKVIEEFLPKQAPKISAKGIILPHAGYPYSGQVAVTTAAQVLAKKNIIILGTNHTGAGEDFGLWAKGAWEVPGASIKINEELASLILSKGKTIKEDYACHKNEHSIEVELPILRYFFGEFKFVPITCQGQDFKAYESASSQIFEAVKNTQNDTLLVASTDLTHYEPDLAARKKDRMAIEAIINLDEQSLKEAVRRQDITMCGLSPVTLLILCLKKLGARKAQVALYQTSGDACGDYSSVVGYAGVIAK